MVNWGNDSTTVYASLWLPIPYFIIALTPLISSINMLARCPNLFRDNRKCWDSETVSIQFNRFVLFELLKFEWVLCFHRREAAVLVCITGFRNFWVLE